MCVKCICKINKFYGTYYILLYFTILYIIFHCINSSIKFESNIRIQEVTFLHISRILFKKVLNLDTHFSFCDRRFTH